MATILVIDDEAASRELVTKVLSPLGHKVIAVRDGEAAMWELEHLMPDLLIVDLQMPRMDGWEFIEQLRHAPERRTIPILVMTARRTFLDRHVAARLARVDAYLTKPFKLQALSDKVGQLLEKK
ncbi:MAG: hypothetical protein AUJ92_11460 [Armatimonadetes bacterium CG2_30_59_28]|nr:response regulator [Armatimonadota bacterium]OIO93862.1 MAG: hypothetical protein AUJ92_11460 [Armatimonadetes bacterium CG2_30_59_28]PIU63564.1 MAG: hypothetical protein COS85_15800 [Armatimonadetes bacterium CG07_land_8_20_14_0_80_59_28]PIX45426.1 MAG: hypothetical protein COZ56_01890 [Armatimonadetes bacterium CG_4_8_14_3_um_filter_58_9]